MREEGIYVAVLVACLAAFGCTSKDAAPAEPQEAPVKAEPTPAPEPVAAKDPARTRRAAGRGGRERPPLVDGLCCLADVCWSPVTAR